MTVTTLTTLTCDHRGQPWLRCSARAEQAGGTTRELMRLFARDKGWIQIKNKDYCPTHAPEHPTHGTVEQEMAMNGYVADENGKMHMPKIEQCR